MNIWILLDNDGNGLWPVAAYASKELAERHAAEMNMLTVDLEVLTELPAEVTDPVKIKARVDEATAWRARYEQDRQRNMREHEMRDALTAGDQMKRSGTLQLCKCETFSPDLPFRTANGYCGYCGGWSWELVTLYCGENALREKINQLAAHDRVKMREICGLPLGDEVWV